MCDIFFHPLRCQRRSKTSWFSLVSVTKWWLSLEHDHWPSVTSKWIPLQMHKYSTTLWSGMCVCVWTLNLEVASMWKMVKLKWIFVNTELIMIERECEPLQTSFHAPTHAYLFHLQWNKQKPTVDSLSIHFGWQSSGFTVWVLARTMSQILFEWKVSYFWL